MAEQHVYKHIEVTGTSTSSSDEAVRNAIATANESVRKLRWFEVTDLRGEIGDDGTLRWQVTIKIGFRIDE